MYVFQVVIQNSKPAKETDDERKLAKGWKGNIDGDEAEEKFFNKLRKTLQTCNVKNTLVINGWKDTGKGGGAEREHDFVIISDPLKTVFLIEVKQNKRGRKSATQQLQSGMEFFNESLVLPEEEKWKFIRIMYFDEKNVASSDCSVFVFTPETDLYDWWKGFEVYLQKQKKLEKVSSLNEHSYVQNCKFLLHQMFQQSQIITEADLSKSSEEFIKKSCNTDMQINETDKKGLCFLTRVQFSLFHDPFKKRVVFNSAYGTGKTLLLKAKAKELLLKGEKVVIVLFDKFKTIFQFLLKKNYDLEFKAFAHNVKVELIKCAGETIF